MVIETISWIFDKLFFFLPRIQVVDQYEGAVFLRKGIHKIKFRKFCTPWKTREMRSLDPGMYWIWPLFDQIYKTNALEQTVDLRCQSAITQDGIDVVIGGAILYDIRTPHKALLNVEDVDLCLSRAALGVLVECVRTKTFDQCLEFSNMKGELQRGVKDLAKNWGLNIKEVQITDFGRTWNLRLLKNNE